MDRRQFLCRLSHLAIGVSTASCLLRVSTGWAVDAGTRDEYLSANISELSYQLLPIREPTSPVYQAVAHAVLKQMLQRPAVDEIVRQGVESMDRFGGKPWLKLTEIKRKEVIAALFDTAYVGVVRWTTQEVVLRDPTVWAEVGYQGSAIEHGGYLHRGFDDIDWLPDGSGVTKQ